MSALEEEIGSKSSAVDPRMVDPKRGMGISFDLMWFVLFLKFGICF